MLKATQSSTNNLNLLESDNQQYDDQRSVLWDSLSSLFVRTFPVVIDLDTYI